MLFTEGEDHRRQRKALSPAFSNAALRAVTSVFYDAAHKAKANWSSLFESSDEAIIDVQKWMNRITLDSIGIAGFGYDFRALEGYESPVLKGFESFNKPGSGRQRILLLGPIFPHILKIPTERTRVLRQMSKATSDMAVSFLENSQSEKESAQYLKDKSILGLLGTHDTPFIFD
ncbi:hypothetical protein APHAL10511_008087 [Amanita phalloides]|nr:hypothetical protein APHAL10511_008087 [Amanita phalloides]